jgi:hypothetical protein
MENGLRAVNFPGPLVHMPLSQSQNEVVLLIEQNINTPMPSIWILHSVTAYRVVDSDMYLSWLTELHATIGLLASKTFPQTASFQLFASIVLWWVHWHFVFILIVI